MGRAIANDPANHGDETRNLGRHFGRNPGGEVTGLLSLLLRASCSEMWVLKSQDKTSSTLWSSGKPDGTPHSVH